MGVSLVKSVRLELSVRGKSLSKGASIPFCPKCGIEYYEGILDATPLGQELNIVREGGQSFRASLSFDTESQDEVQGKPPPGLCLRDDLFETL
jgi:hypothetical protein